MLEIWVVRGWLGLAAGEGVRRLWGGGGCERG